ncbi:hypothetical protein ACL02R_20130 [Streptomyces sp. MS19]|uniref:hypothetical protein n=1 Tax=Streptomyces sp. MS19 TaxID=3385972 RepID=UPI0039A19BC7
MGREAGRGDEAAIRNDVSGYVNGPVGQFGVVHGDVHLNAPGARWDGDFEARYRARLERQWAEEEAARAAEAARAEQFRLARLEEPAVRWREQDARWRRRIAVCRNWTVGMLLVSVPAWVAFALVGEDSSARGPLALCAMLIFPAAGTLLGYVNLVVRHQLWRGW